MLTPEQILANIGPNVKKLRKAKGLTLAELSKEIGVSNPFISQIETGGRNVGITTALRLANFFEMTIDELLCNSNEIDNHLETQSIKEDLEVLLARIEAISNSSKGWRK